MRYVNRLLLIALLVALGIFAFQNQAEVGRQVEVAFLKYRFGMAQGFWLLGCFLAGAMVYMLIDLPRSISLRRRLSRTTRDLDKMKAEAAKQQPTAPIVVPRLPPSDSASRPYSGLENPLGP